MVICRKKIAKLDPLVVSRIAAGEIIVRPRNVVKELLENSLDSEASTITVTIKDGGMKLIQVEDNGSGIHKDDLPLVCERFATSKIKTHLDLNKVETFGFRGEALSSISSVAHVNIVTMEPSEICGFIVNYRDSKIVEPGIVPCAANKGTIVKVEDLFYNVPFRKKLIKNFSEEYLNIVDIVNKYAIRFNSKRFICKKFGSNIPDVNTTPSSSLNIIGYIYGQKIQKSLIEISARNGRYSTSIEGYISNVAYIGKKINFILFVNGRLVDCNFLKKSIQIFYSELLPKSYPFIYLNLSIDPSRVDVNAHPTKREVIILNQEDICTWVLDIIKDQLKAKDDGRDLLIQKTFDKQNEIIDGKFSSPFTDLDFKDDVNKLTVPKQHPKYMVRNSYSTQTLGSLDTNFIPGCGHSFADLSSDSLRNSKSQDSVLSSQISTTKSNLTNQSFGSSFSLDSSLPTKTQEPEYIEVSLESILSLRKQVINEGKRDITNIFSKHVYVGLIDSSRVLLQCDTGLYLVDVVKASEELFRQMALAGFSNFSPIELLTPLSIKKLIYMALVERCIIANNHEIHEEKEILKEMSRNYSKIIMEKRRMFSEYFCININSQGYIYSIPYILKDYVPEISKLPEFIFGISAEVDWGDEKRLFDTLTRELGKFYSLRFMLPTNDMGGLETKLQKYKTMVEFVILPALKRYLIAPSELSEDEGITKIADVTLLYKIFERC